MANTMYNRKQVAPLNAPRSTRNHEVRAISSFRAGKSVPLAAIPLLREDSLSGRYMFSFEMQETAEIILNAVNVDVFAYVVPWLAFDRFQGSMDILNKSWEGVPAMEGGSVVPFYETSEVTEGNYEGLFLHEDSIFKHLGLHSRVGDTINRAYDDAYRLIWNHRAANRSPDIPLLGNSWLERTCLAPAFWKHQAMSHIVPDFDDAAMEGSVPLTVTEARMPVYGSSYMGVNAVGSPQTTRSLRVNADRTIYLSGDGVAADEQIGISVHASNIFAELDENGITVSLANLELARKTQAFAAMRKQYEGHTDEWLIAHLMDGITIPDQHLKDPWLVGHASTIFGLSKRYATDSENLTESAVNGAAQVMIDVNVPRLSTGGIVMLIAEITPDQLWERRQDPLFNMVRSVDDVPHYLRDTLDPQKVEVVQNQYVDIDHDTPTGLFGYAPLNHKWDVRSPRVGGKFYRPEVDAEFDEDRQRIWAVETKNPKLSTDFYVATQMHQKPFLDMESDAFECIVQGQSVINGLTVFGPRLIEASDSYDKVMAEAPIERIEK